MKWLAPIALLIAAPLASAGVLFTADISWQIPTTDAAGNPLTAESAVTEIRLYADNDHDSWHFSGPDAPHLTLPVPATSFHYIDANATAGATFYVAARACNVAGCSTLTPLASKVVPTPAPVIVVPAPPTALAVQVAALIETLQTFLASISH